MVLPNRLKTKNNITNFTLIAPREQLKWWENSTRQLLWWDWTVIQSTLNRKRASKTSWFSSRTWTTPWVAQIFIWTSLNSSKTPSTFQTTTTSQTRHINSSNHKPEAQFLCKGIVEWRIQSKYWSHLFRGHCHSIIWMKWVRSQVDFLMKRVLKEHQIMCHPISKWNKKASSKWSTKTTNTKLKVKPC